MSERRLIRTCSIWRALEIVGDTPTILILEASWLGARRFEEIRARTGLLKALQSDRMKRLVAAEVFVKHPYSETPLRYEYRMTERGRDLYWTALMMLRWERRWGVKDGKIGVSLRHSKCGDVFEPTPSCASCAAEINARDVTWQEGPGVGWMAASYSRRRRQKPSEDGRLAHTTLFDEIAQITGDRWSSLIIRSVFTGLRRFDEIRADTAIATNILSDRLTWLVDIGMLEPNAYREAPTRYEYRLTDKGLDYYPVLLALLQWGDKWYVAPEGPPVILQHIPCDSDIEMSVTCSSCGEAVRAEDVEFEIHEAPEQSVREAS